MLRINHYSIHTERSYCDWIKKFILFHNMQEREELFADSEQKIEAYLSHLAIERHVAPATQNQAMNTHVFLYKKVPKVELAGAIDGVRASNKLNLPVVLIKYEGAALVDLNSACNEECYWPDRPPPEADLTRFDTPVTAVS